MPSGKINKIDTDKGFGFLRPVDGGDDVFFHKNSHKGRFDRLKVGQVLTYELDETAERLRAKWTQGIGRFSSERTGPKPEDFRLGHVTKMFRLERTGLISSEQGGKEILFEHTALRGISFDRLRIGEFVRFLPDPTIGPDDPPAAKLVMREERRPPAYVRNLPRHPRARKKKPSWRKSND